ncbi:MAG: lipoate--protein ligase family protein [Candidatus Omnitrophica bacterium]|nr:lipoate--protein ligase family protein [Candidatus Omnitrophota bacterium]
MTKIKVDHFKEISFANPAENILYDDVLLSLAEQGKIGNTLRIWESSVYFVVLGRTGKVQEDLYASALIADGVPVLRRSSGGGTVVQGPGCLNFSFILSKENHADLADLRRSYHVISHDVLTVLKSLRVQGVFRPTSDLALETNDKKFSGNAQRRGRKFILHHGTILYDFDLNLISRYLAMPVDMPDYRKGRPHEDFIANIPVKPNDFIEKFKNTYQLTTAAIATQIDFEERDYLTRFLRAHSPVLSLTVEPDSI